MCGSACPFCRRCRPAGAGGRPNHDRSMLTFRFFWRRLGVLKSGTPIPGRSAEEGSRRTLWSCGVPSRRGPSCQAGLDGCVIIDGQSPALADRLGFPGHSGVVSDRQRAAALQRFVVDGPVHGLVGGWCGSSHVAQLPRWIHKMNPPADLCSRAGPNCPKTTGPDLVAASCAELPAPPGASAPHA